MTTHLDSTRTSVLLILVITAHAKGKDSKNMAKIQREFHDFESNIVDQKDEAAAVMGKGGRGLKEFWCDLYKYRFKETLRYNDNMMKDVDV